MLPGSPIVLAGPRLLGGPGGGLGRSRTTLIPSFERDFDPRQDSCVVEPIVVLRLIDIGLDLVNETSRPEADPAKP